MASAAERFAALLAGRAPAAPVVFPMVVADHAARIAGVPVRETVTRAGTLARVLHAAWCDYRYDLVMVFTDTVVEAEAMGAQVAIPEDDNPFLLAPPPPGNLAPADPEQDGRMPVVLEATRELRRRLDPDVPVISSIKGPFSLAAFLAGTERFLADLLEDEARALRFLEAALANQVGYARALAAAGGLPFIGDPVASGSLIGPTLFRRFARPFLTRLVDSVHALKLPVGLHVCGNVAGMTADLAATGADYLSIEVDLASARRELGSGPVLMGSVETRLLLDAAPATVCRAAEDCLRAGGPNTLLATGCDVPRDARPDNVRAVVDAARAWSWS